MKICFLQDSSSNKIYLSTGELILNYLTFKCIKVFGEYFSHFRIGAWQSCSIGENERKTYCGLCKLELVNVYMSVD